jgi:hypothetical protein
MCNIFPVSFLVKDMGIISHEKSSEHTIYYDKFVKIIAINTIFGYSSSKGNKPFLLKKRGTICLLLILVVSVPSYY